MSTVDHHETRKAFAVGGGELPCQLAAGSIPDEQTTGHFQPVENIDDVLRSEALVHRQGNRAEHGYVEPLADDVVRLGPIRRSVEHDDYSTRVRAGQPHRHTESVNGGNVAYRFGMRGNGCTGHSHP